MLLLTKMLMHINVHENHPFLPIVNQIFNQRAKIAELFSLQKSEQPSKPSTKNQLLQTAMVIFEMDKVLVQ